MSFTLLCCVLYKSVLAVSCEDCLVRERSIPGTCGIHSHGRMIDGGSSYIFCNSDFSFPMIVFPPVFPQYYMLQKVLYVNKMQADTTFKYCSGHGFFYN